jgi:farnesyl diphosphate synthase
LDCYGDPKVTGKVGTDIEESKCSWLVVQALRKSNHEQLELLRTFYGRQDQESVRKIKDLFNLLDLENEYKRFEQEKYDKIMNEIDALKFDQNVIDLNRTERIKNILRLYAKKIFKRNK